jgi:choloylglycine hydrolase
MDRATRCLVFAVVCLALGFLWCPARACTGIVLRPADNSTVAARTLEFGANLISFELAVIPRGTQFTGQTPAGQPGLRWTAKYGQVGFAPFGLPLLGDGINERGLACGAFYLPGYAKYQSATEADRPRTLSGMDFVSWVLANFATVAEVRQALDTVRVAEVIFPAWGFALPLHYRVVDAAGNAITIEYTDGQLHVFDMPLAVITNSPTYDWHQTNANNYLGLRALNQPGKKIDGIEFAPLGQGSGALGLPGDFTPPSRFVRAAFFVQTVNHGRTADEGVDAAFHILNQFDIPRGSVAARHGDQLEDEVTQWTSAADLANLRYFFHTEGNRRVRVVELSKLDLGGDKIRVLPLGNSDDYQDLSSQFNGATVQIVSGPLPNDK